MSSKSFKTFCKYAASSEDILAKLQNLLNQGQNWLNNNPKAKDAILAAALGTGLGGISGAAVAGKGKRLKGALLGAGIGGGIGAATPTLKNLLSKKLLNDTNEVYPYADIPELMTINELNKHASDSGSLIDKLQRLLNKGSNYLEEIDKDPKKRMLLATAVGTGVGGLAGAGISGKGNRLKGALLGAGIGGVTGAGASYARDLYKYIQKKEKVERKSDNNRNGLKNIRDDHENIQNIIDILRRGRLPELLNKAKRQALSTHPAEAR